MHIVFRESHGLEEADVPQDLGQDGADLAVLSFSDSDLGAFAAGWNWLWARGGDLPQVRLAKINTESHPTVAQRYRIQGIPAFVLFRGGREVARGKHGIVFFDYAMRSKVKVPAAFAERMGAA